MSTPKLPISNFSKGEFSPLLYARVDVPQYQAGAKTVENFIIQRYGGLTFRPGFRFAGEVDDVDGTFRMLPFKAGQNEGRVLLLGDLAMRVMAQGGFLLEEDLKIISMTFENGAVLEVPYHDYAVGDRVYLEGNTGPLLNSRFAVVTAVPDANHIKVSIDTSGMAALTDSTGTVRVAAPPPPPAPPAPLPDPPPEPEPPVTGGGGGSGGSIGSGGGGYREIEKL